MSGRSTARQLTTTLALLAITALPATAAKDRWNRNCREQEDGRMGGDSYHGTSARQATATNELMAIDLELSGTVAIVFTRG